MLAYMPTLISIIYYNNSDCNWYFVCWLEELIYGICEDDMEFDPSLSTCVFPEDYECVLGLYPEW